MDEAIKTVWKNPYVKVLAYLGAVVVAVLAFRAVHPAGLLLLAAFGLAYVVNPVVDAFERRGIARGFGVALVAMALVLAGWLVTVLSIDAITNTLTEGDDGIALTETAREWFADLPANLERLVPDVVRQMIAGPLRTVADVLEQVGAVLAPRLEELGSAALDMVGATVTYVVQATLVLILTAYVLYDYHRFTASFLELFPRHYRETVRSLANTLDTAMGEFIRGQLVVAVGVGLMVFLGLAIIGLPLAGFIALLAGLLNVVPFVGSIVPAIPALVIAIAGGWWQAIYVLVVFVVANQIDSHVLTPLVMSRATELHAVTIMVAVIGGFAFGGIIGAVLAVPLVAFAKALVEEHYKRSRFYRRE